MPIIESDDIGKEYRSYKMKIKNLPTPYYPTRGNNFPIFYIINK